jgi:hypothetical protein
MFNCTKLLKLHLFDKWETTDEGNLTVTPRDDRGFPIKEGKQVIGRYLIQRRTCQDCGLIQLRRSNIKSISL